MTEPETWPPYDDDGLPADWSAPAPRTRTRQSACLAAGVLSAAVLALGAGYALGRADTPPPPPPPIVVPVTAESCADAAAERLGETLGRWTDDDGATEDGAP